MPTSSPTAEERAKWMVDIIYERDALAKEVALLQETIENANEFIDNLHGEHAQTLETTVKEKTKEATLVEREKWCAALARAGVVVEPGTDSETALGALLAAVPGHPAAYAASLLGVPVMAQVAVAEAVEKPREERAYVPDFREDCFGEVDEDEAHFPHDYE